MAVDTAPTPLRASRAVRGRRGIPTRVLLDINDALEPCIEGQALCAEVERATERIVSFAVMGSRHGVANEAGKLAHRAAAYRREFSRLAGDIEGPGAA